ncbi:PAS domain-containing sensor histidine kinase [Aliarcobacter cryaerophilus]|uniref:PAS domain-containing sensor histidine kinase n=1 Tax=Aliarcobacter cryaerophilus TaxID=28198 RepID=UPI0008371B8D|nr:PAS domain-containing sensor histidine kinase [Aliarcobacter cryaerophilus]
MTTYKTNCFYFDEIINSTIEGIIVVKEGFIKKANNTLIEISGYEDEDDLKNKLVTGILIPAATEKYTTYSEKLFQEISLIKKNGEIIPVIIKIKDINYEDENYKIIYILDITEIKDKEKMLTYQSKLSIMGEMISMIAHQWRQPLSSISSAIARIKLKLLSKNLDDEFLQDSLKGINQYIQYLSSTIDDFRNLFSTDTKVELLSLYDIVMQVYSLLDNSFSSQDIKIEIEKKKLSKKFIPKNELMQVIINVLNNAKDVFIERDIKNPIIKIYFKEDDDTQKIYIEDNAGGIEQSIVDKIFSPYFSTKTNKNGSGLGLYICKTILKRDNLGDIDLKVIDNGTQFIITIN